MAGTVNLRGAAFSMEKDWNKLLKLTNKMSFKKEELWLSRIVPVKKNKKELWIISLVNKKKKVSSKDFSRAIKSVNKLDKDAEYWVCEKMKFGKWLCTFYPEAAKKPWRF